jgi:hypothetical protein
MACVTAVRACPGPRRPGPGSGLPQHDGYRGIRAGPAGRRSRCGRLGGRRGADVVIRARPGRATAAARRCGHIEASRPARHDRGAGRGRTTDGTRDGRRFSFLDAVGDRRGTARTRRNRMALAGVGAVGRDSAQPAGRHLAADQAVPQPPVRVDVFRPLEEQQRGVARREDVWERREFAGFTGPPTPTRQRGAKSDSRELVRRRGRQQRSTPFCMIRAWEPAWRGLLLSTACRASHARALIGATTSRLVGPWLIQCCSVGTVQSLVH